MSSPASILVAGATGLVGSAGVLRLLADPAFSRVVVLTRRPIPGKLRAADTGARLEERLVDFDRLDESAGPFSVDQILCALGTTIKKAGTRERFRQVDLEYPLKLARLGLEHGCRRFLFVSALGADPRSYNFYLRVKGELEAAVLALPYPGITIVRPSLLLGERGEFRLGEEIAKRLSCLAPPKFKPVRADAVAAVLVDAAKKDRPGREIIESREIRDRARHLSVRS
jgi:uncharacterized protein YbjT (DUF2867 family)